MAFTYTSYNNELLQFQKDKAQVLEALNEFNDINILKRKPEDCDYSKLYDVLSNTSYNFKNNKNEILQVINNHMCGHLIKHASFRLRDDTDVVLKAVTSNGLALEYASPNIQNNKEVVIIAVTQNGYAFKFASNTLKKDKDVILSAIKNNGKVLELIPFSKQKEYMSIIVHAIKSAGIDILCYAHCDDYIEGSNDFPSGDDEGKMYNYCNIYDHIKETLETHQRFFMFIHGSIMTESTKQRRILSGREEQTPIYLRDHGYYHSIIFLRQIANSAGVVYGDDFCAYQQVFEKYPYRGMWYNKKLMFH